MPLHRFFRQSRIDRQLLVQAAILHVAIAVAVRITTFGRVRHVLAVVAALRRGSDPGQEIDARVVRAVRAVSARLPGANCLTKALVAQCLLARHGCESTLRFGVARGTPSGRPIDAHAWLERRGTGLIGARATAYDPLEPASRCVSLPLPR
jgi:hypothetical protein